MFLKRLSVVSFFPALMVLETLSALAASPPALVNYQGVLRDAADKPRNGTFDMTFHFFDALTAGNEILVDAHTGGGGVVVTGGLFNVALGSGTVTDGSGPGTYASLDQVFRDYAAVWVEVQVGAETLSPRIRVQAEPYALNAGNLQGQPAANFVDTSGSSQTKAGHLKGNGGVEGNDTSLSGVGVQGIGGSAGGVFADSSIVAVSHLGYNYFDGFSHYFYGVHGSGTSAGGWFEDPSTGTYAKLGYGNMGGLFANASGDYAQAAFLGFGLLASASGTGLAGYGTTGVFGSGSTGVSGYGSSRGGTFSTSTTSTADLASGSYGVYANGSSSGGFFGNFSGDGQAFAGDGNYGLYAYGSFAGAYLYDTNSSGTAWIAYGDLGIDGRGAQAGGHFAKPFTNAQSYLAASNGYTENGVYGLSNGSLESPGYFVDQYYGSYAYVGQGGYKIWGSGSVSFVQNDPADASKIIQYTAPEGDETAVYTRGSDRLTDGIARVKLGETFASVANPDLGLTAQVTPRGSAVPLAVESVTTSELVVRGPDGGPPDLAFDYAVWGLRIGFEDRPVVRPKLQEAFIPSTEADDLLYAAHPGLKAFNARQRFEGIEAGIFPERSATKNRVASEKLKAAIHVYDRRTDLPRSLAARPQAADAVQAAKEITPDSPSPAPAGASRDSGAGSVTVKENGGGTRVDGEQAAASLFPPDASPVALTGEARAGDVVTVTGAAPGKVALAAGPLDKGVVGIVGGASGASWSDRAPLVHSGVVTLCNVDASYGAVAVGDLLVSSSTPGHAMRAGDAPPPGTVIAKALEPLDAGTGAIRVLVLNR